MIPGLPLRLPRDQSHHKCPFALKWRNLHSQSNRYASFSALGFSDSHLSAESVADFVPIRMYLLVHASVRPAEMLLRNPGRDPGGIEAAG